MKFKTVRIEALNSEALGIAKIKDASVIVPGVLPGEKVRIANIKMRRGVLYAELLDILEFSPERVEAKCPFFQNCGGCQLQHYEYSAQLSWKLEQVKQAFLKLDQFCLDSIKIERYSNLDYHYRSRVQLKKNPKGQWGYFQKASHQVLAIDQCPIAVPSIEAKIAELAQGSKIDLVTDQIQIYDQGHNQIAEIAARTEAVFQQVNPKMNEQLKKRLDYILDDLKIDRALELYAGSGNLTEVLLPHVRRLTTVELNPKAVALAKDSFAHAQIEVICQESHLFLRSSALKSIKSMDLILLDPPREGAGESISEIAKILPQSIIYISCNFKTLVKDIAMLLKNNEYQLLKLEIFDFFPQTTHVEVMVLLNRQQNVS